MKSSRQQHNRYQRKVFDGGVDFFRQSIPADVDQRTALIVAAADLKPDHRVLDVGTGTGALIGHIQRYGVQSITACDLSPAMLEEAKRRYSDVLFWCGDIVDLPAQLGPFDAVFFNAMFSNVWDQRATLVFVSTLLTPAARVIISHPMGATFAENLHKRDPEMARHLLPDRPEMEHLIKDTHLRLASFQDQPDLYISVLVHR